MFYYDLVLIFHLTSYSSIFFSLSWCGICRTPHLQCYSITRCSTYPSLQCTLPLAFESLPMLHRRKLSVFSVDGLMTTIHLSFVHFVLHKKRLSYREKKKRMG